MFALFDKSVAKIQHPGVRIFNTTFKVDERTGLENLPTDESTNAIREIAKSIKESYPSCISMDILPNCVLASQLDHHMIITPSYVGVKEDVICLFRGELSNKATLQNLGRSKDEENNALIVIDIYRKCYGEESKKDEKWIQAVNTFQGEFSFVLYDAKKRTFFVSTDPVGTAVKCYWGIDPIGNMLFSHADEVGRSASLYYGHIPGGHFVASGKGLRKLAEPNEQIKVEPVPWDDSLYSPPSKKPRV